MLYDIEYAEKAIERNKIFFTKEAEVVKSAIKDISIIEEFGSDIDEYLKKFAALYDSRYSHNFDKSIEYNASSLPLFFLYGVLVGKQAKNDDNEN